jgi:hypothetical protein
MAGFASLLNHAGGFIFAFVFSPPNALILKPHAGMPEVSEPQGLLNISLSFDPLFH